MLSSLEQLAMNQDKLLCMPTSLLKVWKKLLLKLINVVFYKTTYNKKHHITPKTIQKSISPGLRAIIPEKNIEEELHKNGDLFIDNSGSIEELQLFVNQAWDNLNPLKA